MNDIERLIYELFKRLYLKNRNNGQMSQGKVLKILYKKGDISQKEMQDKLNIQSGTMSEIINKLEKKNLLIRQRDDKDRRRVVLHLTDKGKEDVETYSQNYQNNVSQFFDVLSEQEKETLRNILLKLLEENDSERK